MSRKIQRFVLLIVGVLAMSLAIGYLVFAWVEPGANPPQGNVPAPINVGSTAQTKTGNLTLPNLYLNATGNEGNIYAIDQLIGYNDLRLKGRSDEAAPIYYGASEHHFYTAGIERLTILNNGNVGIGTTNPAVAGLHIGSGVSGGQAQLRLDNANGSWGGLNRWTDRLEIISSNAIGFSAGGTIELVICG